MQHITENQKDDACAEERNANLVDSALASSRGGCCGSSELGLSGASIMSGNSRVAVGQVTGSEPEVLVVVDAFDIDGVNSSSAIPAWSWRCPSDDLGIAAVDRQTKSSFDFVDLGPANRSCDEWIHNGDAFIEDEHLGLNKQQPGEAAYCCNDTGLGHPAAIAIENHLSYKQKIDDHDQTREYEGGFWSERKEIGHQTILPSLQTTSSVEGK